MTKAIELLKKFNVVGAAVITAVTLLGGGASVVVWVWSVSSKAEATADAHKELKQKFEAYKDTHTQDASQSKAIVRALNSLRKELKKKRGREQDPHDDDP